MKLNPFRKFQCRDNTEFSLNLIKSFGYKTRGGAKTEFT